MEWYKIVVIVFWSIVYILWSILAIRELIKDGLNDNTSAGTLCWIAVSFVAIEVLSAVLLFF